MALRLLMIWLMRISGLLPLTQISLALVLLVAFGRAQVTEPEQAPSRPPASSVSIQFTNGRETSFPVQISDELLFEVRINNNPRPVFFSIDSGSGSTYLDTQSAKQLGLSPSGTGSVHGAGSGPVPVQHLQNVRFRLPGLTTIHPEINTTDLGNTQIGGHKLDGFFGFDFIRQFVVTIDYDAERVTLSGPAQFLYSGKGQLLPIEFHGKWPFIPGVVKVPGVPPAQSLFLVDSGSGDAVNHPLIKKSRGRLTPTRTGVGLGTAEPGVIGRIEYVQFGNLILRDAPAVCCGGVEEFKTFGQIGTDALKRFKVIFDYARSRIILEPGRMYSVPF